MNNNVFAGGFTLGVASGFPLTALSGNVLLQDQVAGHQVDLNSSVPVLNNYWANVNNATDGSNHGFETGAANDYYRGNIFETLSTAGLGESHCALSTTGSTATLTMLDNLVVPAANGTNSCILYSWQTAGLTQPVGHLDHNGVFGVGSIAWHVTLGHISGNYPANTVLRSFRSNVGWSPTAGTGANLGVGLLNAPPSSAPNNNVDVALETNNAWYNLRLQPVLARASTQTATHRLLTARPTTNAQTAARPVRMISLPTQNWLIPRADCSSGPRHCKDRRQTLPEQKQRSRDARIFHTALINLRHGEGRLPADQYGS